MVMHSSPRNGAKVVWLGVHTTEGIMRATALRDWKEWAGSSHASSDETGALLTPADGFVPYNLAAWTLRNGNARSENIEQCGWARWTRAEWLARPKLLEATARWLADRSKVRGIPLVKLTPAEVKAGKPGVLGHGDYSLGTGDGTHWDPGPGYPWDVVLGRAQQLRNGVTPTAPASQPTAPQEDDMSAEAEQLIREMHAKITGVTDAFAHHYNAKDDLLGHVTTVDHTTRQLVDLVNALPAAILDTRIVDFDAVAEGRTVQDISVRDNLAHTLRVANLAATIQGQDPTAIVAALVAALPADLAKQVADEFTHRLAA